MRRINKLVAAGLGVVSLAMGSSAGAVVTQFVRATANNTIDTTQTYGPVLADDIGVNKRATSFADYGVLKTFATASGVNGNASFFFVAARASAQTYDTLTIGGGAPNLRGIATVKVRIAGHQEGLVSIGQNTDMNSDFSYQLNTTTVGGPSSEYVATRNLAIDVNGIQDRSGVNAGAGYAAMPTIIGYHVIKVPFLFGVPLGIQQTVSCIVGVRSGDPGLGGSSSCNYGNSVYWGGITAVTDEFGNAVSGWSVGSSSLFDYRFASPLDPEGLPPTTVPEPGIWLMLLSGFGLAGIAIRRGRMRRMFA